MRRSFAVEGVVELGTNERSEAALKLPISRKPVCAADHGVQSAAVASGSWRGARGVTAALRAYVTWHARY